MKRQSWILHKIILGMFVLLAVGSASAQSTPATFKVPFGFVAGSNCITGGRIPHF